MARSSEGSSGRAGGRHVAARRTAGYVLVAVLSLGGASLLGAAQDQTAELPPQPAAEAAPGYVNSPVDPDLSPPAPTPSASRSAGMARSEPVRVTVPKIGVDAELMSLGVDKVGMIEVPPLAKAELAGWYRLGPSPGEIGNAVIVGHVDSHETGPAVFFDLGALKAGDRIQVPRKDGSVAEFTVDGVKSYPKTAFPTDLVYGPSDRAGLRLVTCGGRFDRKKRSYPDNIIVFASATETGKR
ncbi:class F sortase [Micromonospora sp. NBC_01796]|uniref:class F sortase n=1 Tax=Micromonospora sp. NBC_01796 TaxID=2975987 RepID=UPI002DDC56BF|nr:class F sortase [Micromonospora sp. NBC_01796]WSA89623.1 class F sortase [Micromonospora sp. NBC_01796]